MDVYGELIFNQIQHNELERLNNIRVADHPFQPFGA